MKEKGNCLVCGKEISIQSKRCMKHRVRSPNKPKIKMVKIPEKYLVRGLISNKRLDSTISNCSE